MSGSMTREDFDAYLVPCLPPRRLFRSERRAPRLGPAGERVYRYGGRHRSERPGAMLTRRWLRPCRINWRNCGISAMAIPTSRCCSWQKPSCSRPLPTRCFSATPAPKPTRRPLSWRGNMPTISLAVKKRNHRLQPRLPRPHAVHRLRWRPAEIFQRLCSAAAGHYPSAL